MHFFVNLDVSCTVEQQEVFINGCLAYICFSFYAMVLMRELLVLNCKIIHILWCSKMLILSKSEMQTTELSAWQQVQIDYIPREQFLALHSTLVI